MRPLPAAPVFDRAALRASGWSNSAIDRAASSGRVVCVRRGWYARPDDHGERAAAIAAVTAIADSVISHRTAVLFHEATLVGERPALPELTVQPWMSGSDRRAHLHRARLRAEDIVLIRGVPVTSMARTLFDIARAHKLSMSVAAIDFALNRRRVTRDQLDDVALFCWNWPGVRRALRALRLSDGRSESALESVSRLGFPGVGIPAPELQTRLFDRHGIEIARLDFYWDRYGAAGEADGRGKYDGQTYSKRSGLDVFNDEKQRQQDAERERVCFARWGWSEVWPRATDAADRVRDAFARGALLDRGGVPRTYTYELTPRI